MKVGLIILSVIVLLASAVIANNLMILNARVAEELSSNPQGAAAK